MKSKKNMKPADQHMSAQRLPVTAIVLFFVLIFASASFAARYMEKLDRGVVAVRVNSSSVYISWRMFGTDPAGIAFNVYRSGTKVNATPITTSTNYTDNTTTTGTYTVRPIIGGVEQADSETATVWTQPYLTIPLAPPPTETMPDGTTCNYSAGDCSVGDLDGDGQYEIVMKWDPSNAKDNSQSGYTGDVFLDAYKLNGTRLWRIDLGRNIRAGAHYTQFMVYDLDSDGKAEVACKTAPGTKDSSGNYLSTGPAASDDDSADYRSTAGYVLTGPEYLTVFNGQTGREMATVNYDPPRGTVSAWGDSYGNRVDRFLACIAYLDGVHPSLVMCRGYYTRTTLAAWDWDGKTLKERWFFDSNTAGAPYAAHALGLGNHNLSVGDVNNDGYDEIVYGPMAIDHNGKAMYDTMLGHGDAMHLGKLVPDRPGLQVWDIHENYPLANGGGELHDAATGEILWGIPNTADTGRGMAGDIDASHRGYEMWSGQTNGLYNEDGTKISTSQPSSTNFRIYWDGDLQDELLDGTTITKWNGSGTTTLASFSSYDAASNNGTKANPCLTADILGDWREEVLYRNSDSTKLMIFTTTTPTNYRFYTLMHDFEYRDSIAWQNVAYNQPPHVDFYLGDGPTAQPLESIIYPGASAPTAVPTTPVPPTLTATKTNTPVPPTLTATKTNTTVPPTLTQTKTNTPVPTNTSTSSVQPTNTSTLIVPTATPTTPVPTNTPIVPTATPTTPVPTNTPIVPTATPTTPVPTDTPIVPTATPTTPVPTNTNTPVPTATPTVFSGSGALTVYLQSAVTTNSTNSPHPQIEVVNTGTTALNLNNVEVRYWINCDCTGQSVQSWVDWAGLVPAGNSVTGNIQTTAVPTSLGGQTNYISYKFTGGLVLQPGQKIEIQSRFNLSDWSNMLQNNDWSYAAYTAFTTSSKTTAYINGTLMWGNEPSSASSQTAQVNNVMSYPNPSTSATGATLAYSISAPTGSGVSAAANGTADAVSILVSGTIKASIYTASGRMIWSKTLDDPSSISVGDHSIYWNGKAAGGQNLASGTYILKVSLLSNGGASNGYSTIIMFR